MTDFTLARKNIRHHRFGYSFTAVIILLMNMSVFFSLGITLSMKEGIRNSRNRLGADMVVCGDGAADPEGILFGAEPSTFYLDKAAAEELREVPHVTDTASRLYLATLDGQSCCDGNIQLIAVEEGDYLLGTLTDTEALGDDGIILGSTFLLDAGDTVQYFGRTFTVRDILDKTSTGYDSSGFITMAAAEDIMGDMRYAEYFGDITPGTVTSMVYISSDNPQATSNIIRTNHPELSVYLIDRKISEYSQSVAAVGSVTVTVDVILWVTGLAALTALTAVTAEARKNETGAYLTIGWTEKKIRRLMLKEQLFVTGTVWLAGTAAMSAVYLLFGDAIGRQYGIPFDPSVSVCVTVSVILLAGDAAVGVVSAAYAQARVLRHPASELIRTGN